MSFRCPTGRSIDGLIFNLEVGGIIANRLLATIRLYCWALIM